MSACSHDGLRTSRFDNLPRPGRHAGSAGIVRAGIEDDDGRIGRETRRAPRLAPGGSSKSSGAFASPTVAKVSRLLTGSQPETAWFRDRGRLRPVPARGRARMFIDEMRRAIAAAPRDKLAGLSGAVWKAYAVGAIGDDDAQALAEAVEARKAVPATTPAPRRVGSRPRSPESTERRRRWVASGWMPPQLAARFTMGEGAALAVIAAEVAKRGRCVLTLGCIAALAGVCRSTVKNAVRQAAALGLLRSEEWRLSAWRSAPNTISITSAEWATWLRMVRKRGAVKTVSATNTGQQERGRSPTATTRGQPRRKPQDRGQDGLSDRSWTRSEAGMRDPDMRPRTALLR